LALIGRYAQPEVRMSQQIAEKLKDIGLDPIVPLLLCAEAIGVSTQTLKNIARRGDLEIIRVSDRRCGIRRSVFDRFLESRKSAVTVTGKTAPRRLGIMANLKREATDGDAAL
jgi:hypothetical protein